MENILFRLIILQPAIHQTCTTLDYPISILQNLYSYIGYNVELEISFLLN